MKKITFPPIHLIIDYIFCNILIFLISFAWLKFIYKKIFLSLLLSLIITFIADFFIIIISRKKNNKLKNSKKIENDIENYMLTLLSSSKKENLIFFKKLFEKKYTNLKIQSNFIIINEDKNKKFIICPFFEKKELEVDFALKTLKTIKNISTNNILFLCYDNQLKTNNYLNGMKNFDIKIYTKKQIYFELFEKFNEYPEIIFEFKENKKLKFKELMNISFSKDKSKKYFFSGILIFFCTFIVKYNIYYVFMSSLLFLFSLVCLIKKPLTYK